MNSKYDGNNRDAMHPDDGDHDQPTLRMRAEKMTLNKEPEMSIERIRTMAPDDIRQMFHELRVYQIELEMQNEELHRAQQEIDKARQRYFDLYDLAPVGYCTVNRQGKILEANLTLAVQLGRTRSQLVGQNFIHFVLREDEYLIQHHLQRIFDAETVQRFDLRLIKDRDRTFWAHLTASPSPETDPTNACRIVVSDITERKQREDAKNLMARLVVMLMLPGDFREKMAAAADSLKKWSGCEAVGIRLREGEDYPLIETRGFSSDFVYSEKYLCAHSSDGGIVRDGSGQPLLECICGCVLDGRFDSSNPNFTLYGSFWTNSIAEFQASFDRAGLPGHPRDRCIRQGFESIALIPLKAGAKMLGMIQFNDRRPGRFTAGQIVIGEEIAESLASALLKYEIEEELRASKAKLEAALFSATDAIFISDAEGRLIEFNEAFARFSKFENKQACLETIAEYPGVFDVFFPDGSPAPADQWAIPRALRGEIGNNIEYTIRRKDTGETWVGSYSFAPIRDMAGTVVGSVVTARDITERKATENAINTSMERLNCALYAAKSGVWEWDIRTNRNFWSDEIWKLYNLEPNICEPSYEAWLAAIHPDDREKSAAVVREASRTGTRFNIEWRVAGYNDAEHWLMSYGQPFFDANGQPERYVGIVMDITERKQAEAERIRLEARLLQTQKMEAIGTLAGGIAHDLNNILFPISGLAELLLEDFQPNSLEYEMMQQIHRSVLRGSDLVKQILMFSRQSAAEKQPVRLQSVMKEVLKLVRGALSRHIEIRFDISADCGMVLADLSQVHQIVMNLVTNAAHAVEENGGTIQVTLTETLIEKAAAGEYLAAGRYACIRVSDTGIGIEKKVLDKIFTPYFTTKAQGKGTGLGLSVVLGIVKDHGGDIRITSEIGQGTTVSVYLPLIQEASDSQSTAVATSYPFGTEHILLVDDEAPVLNMEKLILEKLGYRVSACSSPLQALTIFKDDPGGFDLVLSDRGMPKMTGEVLAREMMTIRPDIPIILCTGFSDEGDELRARAAGIKGYLLKPVAKAILAETIRNVLDGNS